MTTLPPSFLPKYFTVIGKKDKNASILVYDKYISKPVREIDLGDVDIGDISLVYCPDLISYRYGDNIIIWNIETGTLEKYRYPGAIWFGLSKDYIIVERDISDFRVYRKEDSKFICKLISPNMFNGFNFYVNNNKIYLVNDDFETRVYDLFTGKYINHIQTSEIIKGRNLYSIDGIIYDLETHKIVYDMRNYIGDIYPDYSYEGLVVFDEDGPKLMDYDTKKYKIEEGIVTNPNLWRVNSGTEPIRGYVLRYDVKSKNNNFSLTLDRDELDGVLYGNYDPCGYDIKWFDVNVFNRVDLVSLPKKIISLLPEIHTLGKNIHRQNMQIFPNVVIAGIIENLLIGKKINYNEKLIYFLVNYAMKNDRLSQEDFYQEIIDILTSNKPHYSFTFYERKYLN